MRPLSIVLAVAISACGIDRRSPPKESAAPVTEQRALVLRAGPGAVFHPVMSIACRAPERTPSRPIRCEADDTAHLTEFPPYAVVMTVDPIPLELVGDASDVRIEAWPVKTHHDDRVPIVTVDVPSDRKLRFSSLQPNELYTVAIHSKRSDGEPRKDVWLIHRLVP